ncbi:MAG TPA: ComF family protein [Bacteroidales bacterium]
MVKTPILSKIWISDLLNLFFPNYCQSCGNALVGQEEVICFRCIFHLPKTGFHQHIENPISRLFWGRINIYSASSYLFFSKGGNVQQLIHSMKYKGHQETGVYLGELYGKELAESESFKSSEIIVPVPLHPVKQRIRGYNQAEKIANGLSNTMGIPYQVNNLNKVVNTESQTTKTRYGRWENVKDAFQVNEPEKIEGKHILLVDDVLTTGATIEACASKLLQVPDTRVSVVTLAYAQV